MLKLSMRLNICTRARQQLSGQPTRHNIRLVGGSSLFIGGWGGEELHTLFLSLPQTGDPKHEVVAVDAGWFYDSLLESLRKWWWRHGDVDLRRLRWRPCSGSPVWGCDQSFGGSGAIIEHFFRVVPNILTVKNSCLFLYLKVLSRPWVWDPRQCELSGIGCSQMAGVGNYWGLARRCEQYFI